MRGHEQIRRHQDIQAVHPHGGDLNVHSDPATLQGSDRGEPQRVQIELFTDIAAVRPGDTVTVALRQIIAPGWHTYWTNPGDSGEPTRINWSLPEGASAGPIQWPLPHAIPVGPLTNYGYSDEVTLLSEIKVPAGAPGPSFDITAEAKWLVCEQICIPEEKTVRLTLPLIGEGVTPRPSPRKAEIEGRAG
ncbi:MAG: hypothetical protein HC850_04205 [Rhodomicrobium sp.]|nr:hypothetical protein [Rhodomicrobium sp.]